MGVALAASAATTPAGACGGADAARAAIESRLEDAGAHAHIASTSRANPIRWLDPEKARRQFLELIQYRDFRAAASPATGMVG